MTVTAPILKIVTHTDTIDLLEQPYFTCDWKPATGRVKNDGVWLDPPSLDYRKMVGKQRALVSERIDIKLRGANPNAESLYTARIMDAMEQASDFFASRSIPSPVYIMVRPRGADKISYAVLHSGTLEGLENPFGTPYNQPGGRALQANLSMLFDREDWQDAPPNEYIERGASMANPEQNAIPNPGFETSRNIGWTPYNSPTTAAAENFDMAHGGEKSLHIVATAGSARGVYRDITGLSEGIDYDISAWFYVKSGGAYLGAWDGGGFSNAVSSSATTRNTGNLLSNGGFESDLTGWNRVLGSSISRSNSEAYAGTWSMKVDISGMFRTGSVYSDSISIPEGATQMYVSWAYLPDPALATEKEFFLVFTEAPYSGYKEGEEAQDAITVPPFGSGTSKTMYSLHPEPGSVGRNEWESHIVAYAEVPEGANYAYFVMYHETTGPFAGWTETVYLDDITIYATVPLEGAYNNWQLLTVTKECPAGGSIRVGMLSESTLASNFYVDDAEIPLPFGEFSSGQVNPKLANFHGDAQLSFVWYYDDSAGTYTDLMENSFPYNLFPSTVAADDALYFGISADHNASAYVPFSNVGFNLKSSLDASSVDIVWEYWNTSAWVEFDSVSDDTELFTRTGIQVVSWTMPDDWDIKLLNSEYAMFVRARFVTISSVTAVPQENAPHPHVVNKNYVQVYSSTLTGTLDALIRAQFALTGGPVGTITEPYYVIAGSDDASYDAEISEGSLTEATSEIEVGANKRIAVRFDNVLIPDGVDVTKALLYFTAGSTGTSSGNALITVFHEDAADPATFSGGSPGAIYTNVSGRDWVLGGSGSYLVDGAYVTAHPGEEILLGDITQHINELMDAGFVSGNAMSFLLMWQTGGAGQIFMDMYEQGTASTFTLEISYVNANNRISGAVISSRSLERGEDFRSQINLGRTTATIVQEPLYYTEFRELFQVNGAVLPGGKYAHVLMEPSVSYTDALRISIKYPRSTHFAGEFRVFIRAGKATTTEPDMKIKMAYQAGSAAEKRYSKPATVSLANMQLLDMGAITIPDTDIDAFVVTIQAANEDVDNDAALHLYTLILMPSDEFVAEYSTIAGSPYGVILPNQHLVIDGTRQYKEPRIATIGNPYGKGTVSSAMVSGTIPKLDSRVDQRVYALSYSNAGISQTNPAIELVSYTSTIHALRIGVVNRHLNLRGAT